MIPGVYLRQKRVRLDPVEGLWSSGVGEFIPL